MSEKIYYRKRPVLVEAVLVSELLRTAGNDWRELPAWMKAAYEDGRILFLPGAVEILTLEGRMRAERSAWIIRGKKGELYPCRGDIFAETYERVVPTDAEVADHG